MIRFSICRRCRLDRGQCFILAAYLWPRKKLISDWAPFILKRPAMRLRSGRF